MTNNLSFLFPANHGVPCKTANCLKAIVFWNGRFYITFGHAGFNSGANNRSGYVSHNAANHGIRYWTLKGAKARAAAAMRHLTTAMAAL